MRKLIFLCLICLFAFSLSGCLSEPELPEHELEDITYEEMLNIDFTAVEQIRMSIAFEIDEMSSSFEIKDILQPSDKQILHDFLNDLEVREVVEYDEKLGFDVLIEIKTEPEIFLVFKDEILLVNKRSYISDAEIGKLALDLYENMDYTPERLE